MVDFLQIDAFASAPFKGNPAAVCLLDEQRSEEWMQEMAAEMNLSETAFVRPEGNVFERPEGDVFGGPEGDSFSIRWFTPAVEVDLCGHATLASAHALWETGRVPKGQQVRFLSRSGPLTATASGDWIELDFPARSESGVEPPAGLFEALGVMPAHVGRSEEGDLLVEVAEERDVRELEPNIGLLAGIEARGVIVTSRSGQEELDFVSRFFAPASGIAEDPVTGSAHCCLGPYWAPKLRKQDMVAFQASRRGGIVRVRVAGERVVLGGQAVTVVSGRLRV